MLCGGPECEAVGGQRGSRLEGGGPVKHLLESTLIFIAAFVLAIVGKLLGWRDATADDDQRKQ